MAYRKTETVREHLHTVRTALLEAGRRLVADQGFAGVQVARVANGAGVATGTVYGHFASKGALCAEIFAAASQHELDRLELDLSGPGSVRQRIEVGIEAWCLRAQRGRVLATALLTEPVDPEVARARLAYRAAYAGLIQGVVQEGIDAGELAPQNAEVAAACIVGALGEAVLGPLPSHDPEATRAIVRFVLQAIGATP